MSKTSDLIAESLAFADPNYSDDPRWQTACAVIETLATALSTAQGEVEEHGWLIEIAGPKWFLAGKGWNWTKDASAALRFARRQDAESFGRWSHLDIATGEPLSFTEHKWSALARPPQGGDGT